MREREKVKECLIALLKAGMGSTPTHVCQRMELFVVGCFTASLLDSMERHSFEATAAPPPPMKNGKKTFVHFNILDTMVSTRALKILSVVNDLLVKKCVFFYSIFFSLVVG